MKTVLVLGAGRSSSMLISYLLKNSRQYNWHIIVGDKNKAAAENAVNEHGGGESIEFDASDEHASIAVIKSTDVVISLLPPALHSVVAQKEARHHIGEPEFVAPERTMSCIGG